MKIIHTSDWHFGHQLYGYEQLEEHREFAGQLVEITRAEQPDALLVSGDVFDTGMPPINAQQLYAETLIALHQASANTRIIVTAGNHDSPARLEVYSQVWQAHNVTVVGTLRRTNEGGVDWQHHILPVADKGFVVALPHIYPQNYPVAETADKMSVFYKNLEVKLEEINVNKLPVILMAHTAVRGCDLTGHRRMQEDSIGSIEYTDLATFGTVYDYIALGHIHHPQTLKGQPTARYSGAPVAVSFDENYEHSVTLTTVQHGQPPIITAIPVTTSQPLITLPPEPLPFDEAVNALATLPADKKAYIRLNVKSLNGLPPDYNERIAMACAEKKCRYCTVNVTHETTNDKPLENNNITPEEFKQLSISDVANQYLASRGMDEETRLKLTTMINETAKKLDHED